MNGLTAPKSLISLGSQSMRLKGEYVLTREEWEACQRVFKEKGMRTFADWLRYYNNLDVTPGLEMRNFYTEKGIDILKDAVSTPGVSLHYLLRGAVERGAELYTPGRLLVYAPLLLWYVNHGAVITKVYRTIDYRPAKIFPWFVEQVTEARRTGDVEKSKALLAEVFKLLGNSANGKLI